MKIWKLTLGLCLVAGTAAAQTPPDPTPDPTPPPTPTPPSPPTGFVETKPVGGAPMTEPVDDERPFGFSVGIGFGYVFPTSLETPNITSARFRLGSGLQFEPSIRFQQSSIDVDVGASAKTKTTTIEVGALARYPLKSRGRVDLVLLGGAEVSNSTESPPTDNMDKTTTTFNIVYGLACEYWISSHWQVSLNALNTIFSLSKLSEEMGPGTETVTTTTLFGAIYDPSISAMVHLYY